MKLYLASFLEQQNFGSGEIISITHGSKPFGFKVESIYLPFTPPTAIIEKYNSAKEDNAKEASKIFLAEYNKQLRLFVDEVFIDANQQGKTPVEFLPFKEGDTLCSWERSAYTNYRKVLAPYLEQLGYDVVLR